MNSPPVGETSPRALYGPRADCCIPAPLCLAREHRVEEGCGAIESCCQVGLETNLLGEAAIVRCPLGRWGGQPSGKRLAGPGLESVLQRLSHWGCFQRLGVRDQQDVDQVLGPRARSA